MQRRQVCKGSGSDVLATRQPKPASHSAGPTMWSGHWTFLREELWTPKADTCRWCCRWAVILPKEPGTGIYALQGTLQTDRSLRKGWGHQSELGPQGRAVTQAEAQGDWWWWGECRALWGLRCGSQLLVQDRT